MTIETQNHMPSVQTTPPEVSAPYVTSLPAKAELVRRLSAHLILNSFGLPEGIYRPDLLPDTSYEELVAPRSPSLRGATMLGTSQLLDENGEVIGVTTYDDHNDHDDRNQDTSGEFPPSHGFNDSEGESFSTELSDAGSVENGQHSPNARLPERRTLEDKLLRAAFLPLSYVEGFPAQSDGRPFWHRFDFEPADAHEAFQVYLAQGSHGARQLFLLPETLKATGMNGSTPDTAMLQESFYLYYWEMRSKAYDLFRVAEARKIRESRAFETENGQYILAGRLQSMIEAYMLPDPDDPDAESDFFEMLTPKAATDLLKLSLQLSRINAGLPANGPAESNGADSNSPPGASLEVILRNVSRQINPASTQIEESPSSAPARAVALEEALQDPQTAELAQELIIRINQKPSR